MAETDLAAKVIDWLKADGWDIYQEVQLSVYAPTADIVAVKKIGKYQKPIIWIIECKVSFGAAVCAQAYHWASRRMAHYVSIAYYSSKPYTRFTNTQHFLAGVLKSYGIGTIEISNKFSGNYYDEVQTPEYKHVRWNNFDRMIGSLTDLHKTYARAGNADGKKITAFSLTRDHLIEYVKKHPGLTFNEILADINHHYNSIASARSSLTKWIGLGSIKGIEIRYDKKTRKSRLYPKTKGRKK